MFWITSSDLSSSTLIFSSISLIKVANFIYSVLFIDLFVIKVPLAYKIVHYISTSVYPTVCSPPKIYFPSITIQLIPFTLLSAPFPLITTTQYSWYPCVCFCLVCSFIYLICFVFYIPHISEITQYLFLWLISLNIISSRFIHVVINGKVSSFYGWVVFHCMYMPHLLYPFIHCWALRLFLYFGNISCTIENSAAMNVRVHISFWISVSLYKHQEVG